MICSCFASICVSPKRLNFLRQSSPSFSFRWVVVGKNGNW
ncbi:hypothetical protein AAZX31_02G083400 [Glycine max]